MKDDNGTTAEGPLARIRRLYFTATPGTIDRDFDQAIDLLKAMPAEERQRAHVFMEGLAEMRKEFKRDRPGRPPKGGRRA